MLQYSIWRLLIFMVCLLILMWAGVDPLLAAIIAALVSMVISFFVLTRQREQVARQVEQKVETRLEKRRRKIASQRIDEDEEDAEIERG